MRTKTKKNLAKLLDQPSEHRLKSFFIINLFIKVYGEILDPLCVLLFHLFIPFGPDG